MSNSEKTKKSKQKRKRPPLKPKFSPPMGRSPVIGKPKKKETDPQVLALAAKLIEQRKAKIAKAERHARRQLRDGVVSKDAMLKAMRNNKESGAVDVSEGQRRALTRKAPLDPRASKVPNLRIKRKPVNI